MGLRLLRQQTLTGFCAQNSPRINLEPQKLNIAKRLELKMLRHHAFAMWQISRELNFSSLEVMTSLRLVQSVPPSDHGYPRSHVNC